MGPVPRPACGPFGYKSARPANRKDCSRSGCQDSPISVSRGGWQQGCTHSGSVGCSVPRTSVRSGTSAVRAFCVSCRRHGKAIDARNSFRIVARNDCAVWSQWSLLNIPRAKSCFPVFSKHPIIYRVSFRGGPTSPEIIVYGKDFGRRPAPDPAGGTSNLGQCGPIPGRTGHDYGSKLWLGNRTQLWSAGYTPYGDCIGLRVTKYTDREIVYRLGSFYALHYEQRDGLGHGDYELEQGDSVDINVNGAVLTTRVRYRG